MCFHRKGLFDDLKSISQSPKNRSYYSRFMFEYCLALLVRKGGLSFVQVTMKTIFETEVQCKSYAHKHQLH